MVNEPMLMVNEPTSKEARFNAISYLLLWFIIFVFILNTALDSSMLVQEGTICISAKETPLYPMKVRGTAGRADEGGN